MRLQFGVAARDRRFAKAMRRIRARFQAIVDAFAEVELQHPIHEAILVVITDEEAPGFFEEIENNEGYFQVMAGCSLRGSDDELVGDVFSILRRAMRLCPFAIPDQVTFEELFERFRPSILNQ